MLVMYQLRPLHLSSGFHSTIPYTDALYGGSAAHPPNRRASRGCDSDGFCGARFWGSPVLDGSRSFLRPERLFDHRHTSALERKPRNRGELLGFLLLPPYSQNSTSLYCISLDSKRLSSGSMGRHLVLVRFLCAQYSACARQGYGRRHGSLVVAGRGGAILFCMAVGGACMQQRKAALYRAWRSRTYPSPSRHFHSSVQHAFPDL